jgi:predicted enzyme related to lactoylglutathione lyase
VTVYMKVDDLQGRLEKAERLGGETAIAPTDLAGEFGRFALLADPDGHTVGIWS